MDEERVCNECGEIWTDGGEEKCPYCGSEDIAIFNEDDEGESDEDDLDVDTYGVQ